jgi:polar amino acid transport system permease protein
LNRALAEAEALLAYTFDWNLVLGGEYGDWIVQGLVTTLKISALAIFFSLVLGTLVAVLRLTRVKPLVWFSAAFTEFFRNTPLLVQIFFWYFGSYSILPEFVNKWLYRQDFEFAAGVIALTVYTAAFIAEDIRSGIFAIPKTQIEASRATGLSFLQSMRFVILPQAFRIIIPPLISQFLNVVKNSSLVMTIGVMDLTYMTRQIESYTFHGFEAFTVATVIYLAISLVVSCTVNIYNKRVLKLIPY